MDDKPTFRSVDFATAHEDDNHSLWAQVDEVQTGLDKFSISQPPALFLEKQSTNLTIKDGLFDSVPVENFTFNTDMPNFGSDSDYPFDFENQEHSIIQPSQSSFGLRQWRAASPPPLPLFYEKNTSMLSLKSPEETMKVLDSQLGYLNFDVTKPRDCWEFHCIGYGKCDQVRININIFAGVKNTGCGVEFQRRFGDPLLYHELYVKILYAVKDELLARPLSPEGSFPPQRSKRDVGELDGPVPLSEEMLQTISNICSSKYLDVQREALLVLARCTVSSENQKLLGRFPSTLELLDASLDSADEDILRLTLRTWINIFQEPEHRAFVTHHHQLVAKIVDIITRTLSNELKVLASEALLLVALTYPRHVLTSPYVSFLQRSQHQCGDERLRQLCKDTLQLVQ